MLRVLEPELMDTVQDAEEYDAMDFREPNERFALEALALLGGRANAAVLDVGTGTAQIPIMMLERRADLDILAIDLAQEMLKVAARNVLAAGFDDRCKLARLDLRSSRVRARHYDLVICNSTVHHIADPQHVFSAIRRAAKEDAAILVRDLIRPASMNEAWAIVKRVAAGESKRQQQLFFDSLCAALTLDEVREHVHLAGLGRVRVRQVSDRHWSAERRVSNSPA